MCTALCNGCGWHEITAASLLCKLIVSYVSVLWGALCIQISEVNLSTFTELFHEDFFLIVRRN